MSSFCAYTDVRVYGVVQDSLGTHLLGAQVNFISSGGDTISTSSDSTGYYSVELPSIIDNVESENQREFTLRQNYPNPFNPSTTIEFEINKSSDVKLEILNVTGQRIRTLVDGYENSGFHSVNWDGQDDSGKSVSAGIYIYRLKIGSIFETKKMMLLDGGSVPKSRVKISPAKPSIISSLTYNVIVKKSTFIIYEENGFSPGDSPMDIQKDFVLIKKDYFPLAVGNSWTFIVNSKEVNYEINETRQIAGKEYFVLTNSIETYFFPFVSLGLTGYPLNPVTELLLRKSSDGELMIRLNDNDYPLYKFSDVLQLPTLWQIKDYYYEGSGNLGYIDRTYGIDEDYGFATPRYGAKLITPLGYFKEFYCFIGGADLAHIQCYFVENIGPVKAIYMEDDDIDNLIRAKVNGITYGE